ncbi:MAG: flagellar biosynthetic protein FliO [Buchnera aphidicola (Schlechtendalia peitan)]
MFSSNVLEVALSKFGMLFLKIITVCLVFFWVLRKIFIEKKNINNSLVTVLEKVSVGSNETIVVIDLKEVRLVLGVTAKNIVVLYKLPPETDKSKKILLVPTISVDNKIKQFTTRFGIKK